MIWLGGVILDFSNFGGESSEQYVTFLLHFVQDTGPGGVFWRAQVVRLQKWGVVATCMVVQVTRVRVLLMVQLLKLNKSGL